ncbi:uncharacterized protein LOC133182435 [Saccostrea echinata]|uniref:uncharacterized protein LOC133182435 n=1 Tax=Saccostrea echinata TaxID=191078 RepID=UPI002A820648|nr:uncharacterized protein LOC133182435 [Saccostrea echinata]
MAGNAVDVYVKLPTGRTTTLNLLPGSRISEINKHVGREEGVPDDRVILKYQGKILDGRKTVGQYGVRAETILKAEVVIPRTIQVYVKLPDGRSVPVTVQTTDLVASISSALSESEDVDGSSFKYQLSGGRALTEDQPLFSQGVGEESTIEAKEKPKASNYDPFVKNTEEASEEIKDAVLSSFAAGGKNVEVVFSFDTTGSMASYLNKVRENLQETCRRLLQDIPNIRVGLIAHGDYCDQNTYVIRQLDLTSDVQQLVDFANNTPSTGGGDTPECYEWMLHKAKFLDWSEDSAKALVVIGDAPPHPPSYTDQNINWWNEVELLKGMGVKIYGVLCNRSEGSEKHFYEEIAEQTGGCFLHLNHFNLITQMFLAVCYSESSEDQLEAFTDELEKEGKLTEDTKVLMKEIGEKKPKEDSAKANKEKKSYSYDWWDIQIDADKKPLYKYNANEDHWSSNSEGTTSRSSYSYTPPPEPAAGKVKSESSGLQEKRRNFYVVHDSSKTMKPHVDYEYNTT